MSEIIISEVVEKARLGKKASYQLNNATTEQKNKALGLMAYHLEDKAEELIHANKIDLARGEETGLRRSLLDRLALDHDRIKGIADGLRQIVGLEDPIGTVLEEINRPNGLKILKKRVPIGLIGMIYEARPNVTVDAAGLCLKTGNAVLLRGGSSALQSNRKIVEILHDALRVSDLPPDAIQLVESSDRSSVDEMLKLNSLLDVVIPRGGASLIQNVVNNATVPVIETGAGICHTYIDGEADTQMAAEVAFNAKVQRPSVCNAMETLLVHEDFDPAQLKILLKRYAEANVELKGCRHIQEIYPDAALATEEDYRTEYNDYMLNLKIVQSLDEALQHIQEFGTKHSECIVTKNAKTAERFLNEVDAAAVYHNASTRFTDGFEFGFGAEIGISTQKLHARGPMGLPALTSTKYLVHGSGQVK